MKAIVAVDNNWAIGYKGQLLIRIPADQKRFAQITTGKVVVYGRKTLDTFPGQAPLKNRTNIVLSRKKGYKVPGAMVVNSAQEARDLIKTYDSDDVYIIGGTSIYEEFIGECDTAYVTKIDFNYQADTHFPNLDKDTSWKITERSDEQTCHDIIFEYLTYERV